jgi:hypothetical protein
MLNIFNNFQPETGQAMEAFWGAEHTHFAHVQIQKDLGTYTIGSQIRAGLSLYLYLTYVFFMILLHTQQQVIPAFYLAQ